VFVGSSLEGKRAAEAVQLNLDRDVECDVWSQGIFGLSESPIESLERASRGYDFAVLVVTPDDIVEARGERQEAPRDNVLFEAGYFTGRSDDRGRFSCVRETRRFGCRQISWA
jgi:predicted nucleotide-binding protein